MLKAISIFSAEKPAQASNTKKQKKDIKKSSKKIKDKKDNKNTEPAKKRGRPTNAELAEREKIKRDAEVALRKELLERQQKAQTFKEINVTASKQTNNAVDTKSTEIIIQNDDQDDEDDDLPKIKEYKTDFTSKVKDPNWVPPWPIFFPGQRVEAKFGSMTFEGTVGSDNVESALIRVKWDDGSIQYAAKMNLKLIQPKKLKKVFSQKIFKMEE